MKYAVRLTAFHGARTVSTHRTITGALRALKRATTSDCQCGCAAIVPAGASRPGEDAHYTEVVGADDQRDEQTGEYPRFCAEWAAIDAAEVQS
jgi:hypothetical protein